MANAETFFLMSETNLSESGILVIRGCWKQPIFSLHEGVGFTVFAKKEYWPKLLSLHGVSESLFFVMHGRFGIRIGNRNACRNHALHNGVGGWGVGGGGGCR